MKKKSNTASEANAAVKAVIENKEPITGEVVGEAAEPVEEPKENSKKEAVNGDAPKAEKAAEATNVMYLGPSVTHKIRSATVFKDGVLSEAAEQMISELPVMRILFVPVDEVPEMVKRLGDKDSAASQIYKAVAKHFN